MNLFETIDATWPAAAFSSRGAVILRDGQGGGKRVSAASAPDDVSETDLDTSITAMFDQGDALFQVQGDQPRFDALLDVRRFQIVDPVVILAGDINTVAGNGPPKVSAFTVWPSLAIQHEIWASGGIGPARLAIMDRARGPKTTLIGRVENQPGGAAFVAIHNQTAMIHAVEVLPRHRRKGCAGNMLRAAAVWARNQGATQFATLTVRENAPARALFASLGLSAVGQYHYRLKSNPKAPHGQEL